MTKSGTGTWGLERGDWDVGLGDAGPEDVGPGDAGPGDVGPGDVGPEDVGRGDVGLGVIYYKKLTVSSFSLCYQDSLQFHCSHSHFSSSFLQCYQAK